MSRLNLNVAQAYLDATRLLLREREVNGHTFRLEVSAGTVVEMYHHRLDEIFSGKDWWRHGAAVTYTEWMIGGIFPQILYRQNNSDLRKLMADERFYAEPTYHSRNNNTNFFGRMARPRAGQSKTFLEYLLERWEVSKSNLSYRHFYFDVESPEWVFAELIKNPKQPKTGRTATACVMNWSFHVSGGKLIMCLLMRSMQWSHIYGDFYGSTYAMQALLKEMKLKEGTIYIFTPSIKMDTLRLARTFVDGLGGDGWPKNQP